jgi:IS1 family transposase
LPTTVYWRSPYNRCTGEIVAYVWGKRNYKTAKKLRDSLKSMGISYDTVYTDGRDSFISVFQSDNHIIGKEYTKGIEGKIAACDIESGVRSEKLAVSQRNCLTI